MLRKRNLTLLTLCMLACLLSVLRLGTVPPVRFDEGWSMSLARNWVELGHYGYLLAGKPTGTGGSSIGLPAVAPIALSFRLFGVGVWQGRLPGVVFTWGALGLLYYLARRFYNPSVALGTLASALLLSAIPSMHTILIGRQALGEMPALFFVLAGLAAFSQAWRKPGWSVPLAALSWALAMRTKPQVLPFFVVSLSLPLLVAIWKRNWRTACVLTGGLLGALALAGLMALVEALLLSSSSSGNDPYQALRDASWWRLYVTLEPRLRLMALVLTILFGLPQALGLAVCGSRLARRLRQTRVLAQEEVGRLILWAFAASWLCWYLLFSIGAGRYLFPPMFVGSVFVAALLQDVAGGFNLPQWVKKGPQVSKERRSALSRAGVLLVAVAVTVAFVTTLVSLYYSYARPSDAAVETAQFLNTETRPDALIETYDAELFFLLQRPYHYPPGSVLVRLNQRTILGQDVRIDYDPLAANPDYLVVGPGSRSLGLYESVLATNAFRLLNSFGPYDIYERVRQEHARNRDLTDSTSVIPFFHNSRLVPVVWREK